jgi:hypothetical protein
MAIEEKLNRIISILEKIEGKLYNEPITASAFKKEKPAKKLPMDKDPVFRARLMDESIADHNQKIDKAIDKGKKGLPLTKHEQGIYNAHLKNKKAGS